MDDIRDFISTLHKRRGKPSCGIIYCRLRNMCNELASYLRGTGINARPYHKGLKYFALGSFKFRQTDMFIDQRFWIGPWNNGNKGVLNMREELMWYVVFFRLRLRVHAISRRLWPRSLSDVVLIKAM